MNSRGPSGPTWKNQFEEPLGPHPGGTDCGFRRVPGLPWLEALSHLGLIRGPFRGARATRARGSGALGPPRAVSEVPQPRGPRAARPLPAPFTCRGAPSSMAPLRRAAPPLAHSASGSPGPSAGSFKLETSRQVARERRDRAPPPGPGLNAASRPRGTGAQPGTRRPAERGVSSSEAAAPGPPPPARGAEGAFRGPESAASRRAGPGGNSAACRPPGNLGPALSALSALGLMEALPRSRPRSLSLGGSH